MSSQIPGTAVRNAVYGIKVDRAAANLPASTNAAIFNVVGGRVLVTSIFAICTTVIQTQACNARLTTNSTTGNVTTNLCADLDIGTSPVVVGEMLGITGTPATAMARGSSVLQNNEILCAVGTIRLVTSATNTGQLAWVVTYIPLDNGASITAA